MADIENEIFWAPCNGAESVDVPCVNADFARKQADEIERLRKEHDDLLAKALGVEAERDIARDENERLRAALQEIAEECPDSAGRTDSQRKAIEALTSGK